MLYFECLCNVFVIWFWGVGEILKMTHGRLWAGFGFRRTNF